MSIVPTVSDVVQNGDLNSTEETMATSPNVVYKPVALDPQTQFELARESENSYWRDHRKTVNIVVCIITCLVIASIISVIIVLLSPRQPGTTYTYEMIPTNITAHLVLTTFPDNSTIESDFQRAIDNLYNQSVFSEVYVETIVLDLERRPNVEITVFMIFTDIGDHLGAKSGSSEEATDVFDLFLIALQEPDFYGFHVQRWRIVQDN
ncbi:uncharacterized protein [Apostichopus japonicus]|uniref:uncharacterized protein isoform X1 n=2 Tax=Stichopus japonicus TaxID=307972 RepID=UPI003AB79A72